MLAGQQITALTKINARSSEFEPKYLRTSIALWVDGGSEETQYSVLSTRYSVHSVFSSWYSTQYSGALSSNCGVRGRLLLLLLFV